MEREKSLGKLQSFLKPYRKKIKQADDLLAPEIDSFLTDEINRALEEMVEDQETAHHILNDEDVAKELVMSVVSRSLFNNRKILFNRLLNLLKQKKINSEAYFLTLLPKEELTNKLADLFKINWRIVDLFYNSKLSQLHLLHIYQGVLYIDFKIDYNIYNANSGATLYRLVRGKYNKLLRTLGGIK